MNHKIFGGFRRFGVITIEKLMVEKRKQGIASESCANSARAILMDSCSLKSYRIDVTKRQFYDNFGLVQLERSPSEPVI